MLKEEQEQTKVQVQEDSLKSHAFEHPVDEAAEATPDDQVMFEGFGEEVKRRILLGTYALSSGYYDAYYKKALAVRQELRREHEEIFKKCDLMLTPTAPTPAYGIDENINEPVKMYLADVCTVTANIAGIPAISTPCGYSSSGMPIGFSLSAKQFDDAKVIQLADAFERQFKTCAPVL